MRCFSTPVRSQIEYVPVPSDLTVVLCDTTKERALTTSAYNERRSQCEMAAQFLGVKKLRDADMRMLNGMAEHLPEVVYRRARHVITENDRCIAFKTALSTGDYEEDWSFDAWKATKACVTIMK